MYTSVCVLLSLSLSLFVQARGDLDEDGFFEGDLYGRVGLVPCNMVEHITDAAVLADIDATIATLAKNRQGLPRSFQLLILLSLVLHRVL